MTIQKDFTRDAWWNMNPPPIPGDPRRYENHLWRLWNGLSPESKSSWTRPKRDLSPNARFAIGLTPDPYAAHQELMDKWDPGPLQRYLGYTKEECSGANEPRLVVMPWEKAIKSFRAIAFSHCPRCLIGRLYRGNPLCFLKTCSGSVHALLCENCGPVSEEHASALDPSLDRDAVYRLPSYTNMPAGVDLKEVDRCAPGGYIPFNQPPRPSHLRTLIAAFRTQGTRFFKWMNEVESWIKCEPVG